MSSAVSIDEGCVLVVDDEEHIRDTLSELIEMAGCSAMVAANGAEALELLEHRRPCLIILDLFMPVMGGAELLEELRRVPELASLPVVISTSAPYRAPAGMPVLPKPVDIDAMWGWMERTCRCREARARTLVMADPQATREG